MMQRKTSPRRRKGAKKTLNLGELYSLDFFGLEVCFVRVPGDGRIAETGV
jgi:hypothetical protein